MQKIIAGPACRDALDLDAPVKYNLKAIARDLAPGNQIIFAACGVTDGALLHGVRFFGDGGRTHTLAMTFASRQVRFIDTVHMFREPRNRGVRLY
jgi:fructose-1,6-bisphosphatase/sedoheptulose 1,7-bisphosphatase-like protein